MNFYWFVFITWCLSIIMGAFIEAHYQWKVQSSIIEKYTGWQMGNNCVNDQYIIKKMGVLWLALQLNFWVALDTCNSLYFYAMSVNKQVAWVADLQLSIYMVQLIAILSKQFIFNYYAILL
jgi:hypothetical protein